ncbi:hypothetical protein IGI67_002866 [Enterococcus sp. AZ196]
MKIEDDFLKLQITTQEMLRTLMVGLTGMISIAGIIGYIFYVLFQLFKANNSASILLIIKTSILWNPIPVLLFLGIIFWISSLFFFQGISDLTFLLKHQGIFFYMDQQGIQYYNFETKEVKRKTWSEFEDVGSYRQESEKLVYKYQIKFTNGEVYNFDLRGSLPTKEFKEKIEAFYLRYSE